MRVSDNENLEPEDSPCRLSISNSQSGKTCGVLTPPETIGVDHRVMTELAALKIHARKNAKSIRAQIDHPSASQGIISQWPESLFAGAIVAGYWPIKDELDLRPLMTALAAKGHRLALPAIIKPDHPLEFRQWAPDDPLEGGPFNSFEPLCSAAAILPTVVLLPLLAFTDSGERLGYGGGFYDRTLASLRSTQPVFACGVAFAQQKFDHIPTGDYDIKLDGILTEEEFRQF